MIELGRLVMIEGGAPKIGEMVPPGRAIPITSWFIPPSIWGGAINGGIQK